jgi:hypothetical protein
MSLKPVIDSLDQVSEDLRQHYIGEGDKFILQMDGDPQGFVPRETHAEQVNKVAEFRDNNVKLKAELEAQQEAVKQLDNYRDLDPTAAREALAQVAELSKKGVRKASDVDEQVKNALLQFKTSELEPLRQLLTEEKTARQEADKKVSAAAMKNEVLNQFKAAGGQDAAVDFVVSRANDVFKMDGNQLVAREGVYSVDNPGEPMGLSEWMTKQTKEIAFAFGSSNGGGAHNREGNPVGTIPAGVRQLRNPTPQQLGEHAKDIREGKVMIVNE